MELSDNVFKRHNEINKIAKEFFSIDFENSEFHMVLCSTLISLLIKKGIFSEEELEEETKLIGDAYKLMKYRNSLQNHVDTEEI